MHSKMWALTCHYQHLASWRIRPFVACWWYSCNNNVAVDGGHVKDCCRIWFWLESMDAPEVPHLRPTRLPTRRTASGFFFFFLGFASTRLDSRRCGSICAESGWFGQNRAVSAILGRIGRRPIRSKHTRNGRNRPWIWPKKPKLAFFFLFLWIKA